MSQLSKFPLDPALEAALKRGFTLASQNDHEFFTLEHMLWGALGLPSVINMLVDMGVNVEELKTDLERKISELCTRLPEGSTADPNWTRSTLRVIHRATEQAMSSSSTQVSLFTTLANLLEEKESFAAYMLESRGVTQLKIRLYASHGPEGLADPNSNSNASSRNHSEGIQAGDDSETITNPLQAFTTDLNARAQEGKIDLLIGREYEVRRTAQILSRRRKNNPLLVGEPGVGKTAIAEGLARLIVEGKAPDALSGKKIYALEMSAILAGTKYRGDFEKRIKAVIDAAKADPDVILFMDEIHTMIGAGAASGAVDASNILKPALSSGELRMIGATTFQEYSTIFEKEKALDRRFQKVDILEPSPDEALEILKGVRKTLEAYHQVRYTSAALSAAVDLSVRYQPTRLLPDKAIDLLDEAAAAERLVSAGKARKVIDRAQIEKVLSEIARVPVGQVSKDEKNSLEDLEKALSEQIFGQEQAIDALVSAVYVAKAGMNDPRKPEGSFLFAGPTGVGKTEVTRVLSEVLGLPLLRFDMSEYMESHSVARLIGAPPGYVGSDKNGLLTDAVSKEPHSLLLLDEVEKAHPDVLNVLLQILDNGSLTDANGKTVNFRNTTVVLTTNAGAQIAGRPSMGFLTSDHESDGRLALERSFPPELRNRLDAIVSFSPLSPESIAKVVDKNLNILASQLSAKDVELVVGENARSALAKEGYVPAMGARPMARVIHEKIKKPLSKKMLFGELQKGGTIHVDIDDQGNWVWSDTPLATAKISSATSPTPEVPPIEQEQEAGPPRRRRQPS